MMQQEDALHQLFPSVTVSPRSFRERVGISLEATDPVDAITSIAEAELAGVQNVWMTAGGAGGGFPDILTLFAAAAVRTRQIRLGTAIAYTSPRHPLMMAQQALVLHALAPGRLRLGIGPGNPLVMEGWYGLPQTSPLPRLKEYLQVLRGVLWEGNTEHHGTFFQVGNSDLVGTRLGIAPVPLLISALGKRAFRLAGEIADGALSWMCPIPYLLSSALPELRAGAQRQSRPVPPLIAHVLVALSTDEAAVLAAIRPWVQRYAQLGAYAAMFAQAGFAGVVDGDEEKLNTVARTVVISGDEAAVRNQVKGLLVSGLDELMLTLIPIADKARERKQLFHLIGSLPA